MGTSISLPGAISFPPGGLVDTGEETIHRALNQSNNVSTGSQTLRLVYFTARKSETTTQVRVISGGTAAGATPSLVRVGLYSIAADGAGTLVASTANDTSLLSAQNTAYTKAWSASYAKGAGQRYAVGLLVVTAAAAPTLVGSVGINASSNEFRIAPALAGTIAAQADLPASFVDASVSATPSLFYAAVLP